MPMVGTSKLLRDHRRHFARNAFQHDAARSGAFQRERVMHQLLDRLQRLALDLVAAHGMHRLRRQPDVSDDWNLRLDHAFDQRAPLLAAFDLDRLRAASLMKRAALRSDSRWLT